MKKAISMQDIISRLEKKDEIYSSSTKTSSSSINTTDSEYSSSSSSSSSRVNSVSSGSRPCTPPSVPSTSSLSYNVLNIEDGGQVCRQLPCKTWVSTGTCPYARRCQYIHDPRAETLYGFNLKSRKKAVEDNSVDSLFWPPLPRGNLLYDRRNEPITSQQYLIPHHQNAPYLVKVGGVSCMISKHQAEAIYRFHYTTIINILLIFIIIIISMYNYFIDFLNKDAAHAYEKMYTIPTNDYMMYENQYNNSVHHHEYHDYSERHNNSHIRDINYECNEYHYDASNEYNDYNGEDDYRNYNEHTGKRRLAVFISLSEGRSI